MESACSGGSHGRYVSLHKRAVGLRPFLCAMVMGLGAAAQAQPFPSFQLDTARVVGRDLKVSGSVALAGSSTGGMVVRETYGVGQASRLTRSMDVIDTIPLNVTGFWDTFSSEPAVACSDSGYAVVWSGAGGLGITLVSSDGDFMNRVIFDAEVQVHSLAVAARPDRYVVVYDGWFHSSQSQDVRAIEVAADGAILRRTLVARADGATPSVASSTVARGDSAYLAVFEGPYSDTSDINGRFVWPEDSSADTEVIHIRQGCRAFEPQVAFDGEYFWVAWLEETVPYSETVAKVARVTQRGVVLDTCGIVVKGGVQSIVMAAARETTLVALRLQGNAIVGMRYDAEAQLLDSVPLLMTTHGGRGPLAAVSADTFLVVWFDIVEGVTEGKVRLAGRRITASGEVIDPDVRDYAFSADNHWIKRAAIASDGKNFLAVWCDERAEPDYVSSLRGRRIDNQGQFLDAEPFTITDHHLNPVRPVLSYGAGCYFLCWTEVIAEEADVESTFATRITREGELVDTVPICVSRTSGALGMAFVRDSMFVVLAKHYPPGNVNPYVIRVMADGRVLDSVPRELKVKQDPDFIHCSGSISSIGDTLVMACCMLGHSLYWDAVGLYDPELRQYDSIYWRPPPGTDWAHGTQVACGGGRILMATTQRPTNGAKFYLLDSAGNVLNDSLPLPDLATGNDDYSMIWDGANFMCASSYAGSAKGFRISRDGDALDPWPYVGLVEFETASVVGKCNIAADTMGHVGFAFFTFEPEGYMSTRARVSVFPRLTVGVESPHSVADFSRLQVGPNPSTGIVWLKLGASATEPQAIAVRDIAGRVRTEVSLSPASAERGRTMLDLRKLSAGVYFCTLSSGRQKLTRKFVLTE